MSRRPRPADRDKKRWAAVRVAVFERDGRRCRACGKAGRLECDHVIPLHAGGAPWDMANLQAVCRGCHRAKSLREQRAKVHPDLAAWRTYRARLLRVSE